MTRRLSLFFCVLAAIAVTSAACGRYLTTGVAVVNGASISQKALDGELARLAKNPQYQGLLDTTDQRLQVERQVIVQLIQRELLRQEAERNGVRVTTAQLDDGLNRVHAQFPDEASFQQALQQNGLTLDQLRTQVRDQLLLQGIQDKVAPAVTPTEEELRAAYGNGSRFESIRVRHILFTVPQGGDPAPARKKAQDALAKLKDGTDFATLAKQVSEDPGSKAQGGDLGVITRDTNFVAEFIQAAFALKVGQLSGLVLTQFGYHIIRVDAKTTKTFEQVRAQLTQEVVDQKKQQEFQAYLAGRVKEARIIVNPRYGDFDPANLNIVEHKFFEPASPKPAPQTQVVPQS